MFYVFAVILYRMVSFPAVDSYHRDHTALRTTRTVDLKLSWFVAPFQRLSTLVAPCSSIGFCNITAELFSKGLCSWTPKNRYVAFKGGFGLRLRNSAL